MSPYEKYTLAFTVIVAISTFIYAILTWRLTAETIKLRKAQTEPKIAIYIASHPKSMNTMCLNIENIGSGLAHDLNFSINPELIIFGGVKLSEQNYFKRILYLKPGQKIEAPLINMVDLEAVDPKQVYNISGDYKNDSGEKENVSFLICFDQFMGLRHLETSDDPDIAIARSLPKIVASLDKIEQTLTNRGADHE